MGISVRVLSLCSWRGAFTVHVFSLLLGNIGPRLTQIIKQDFPWLHWYLLALIDAVKRESSVQRRDHVEVNPRFRFRNPRVQTRWLSRVPCGGGNHLHLYCRVVSLKQKNINFLRPRDSKKMISSSKHVITGLEWSFNLIMFVVFKNIIFGCPCQFSWQATILRDHEWVTTPLDNITLATLTLDTLNVQFVC